MPRRVPLRRACAALVLLVVVLALLPSGRASALSPIEPDNKPLPVAGATNGAVPASLLRYVSPSCVAETRAASSLIAMMQAARAAGIDLQPTECYRDYAGQVAMRDYWCGRGACQFAAVPGTSNHGWGKAADLRDQFGEFGFGSPGYAWLVANAWRWGWNHPGWADPGGSAPEAWHWEWVGDGGVKYPGMTYGDTGSLGAGIVLGGNPIGVVESFVPTGPGRATVAGWAIDPDVADPVEVHAYVNGFYAGSYVAGGTRPDVGAAFPGYGGVHGFAITYALPVGAHQVCISAINRGLGTVNTQLGCTWVVVPGEPAGSLDGLDVRSTPAGGAIVARGWALDPDDPSPAPVHIYVDGVGAVGTAGDDRPDIGAAFPELGAAHGFAIEAPAGHGLHQVCAYAINRGHGLYNTWLGCRSVWVDRNPFGALDEVTVSSAPSGSSARVRGWALDPDGVDPSAVHVYVDGVGYAVTAGSDRPDVAAAFPAWGPQRGLDVDVPVGHGTHQVCAYAINRGPGGANPWLGCRTVSVDRNPVGALDEVTVSSAPSGATARVRGWAFDPDGVDPSAVHVYVDGVGYAVTAAGDRPDVAAAFPAWGPQRGYDVDVPVGHGTHQVCAYAINRVRGTANTWLGCRTVTVDRGPFGAYDDVGVGAAVVGGTSGAGAGVVVRGWAIDPDLLGPATVHVYVDAVGVAALADVDRPDVGAAFPAWGSNHGFEVAVPAAPGRHEACVWAIDAGAGGGNRLLGCRSLIVG